jgi:hypothetical protein
VAVFNHFQSERPYCQIGGAEKDQVWTQFYRLLDQ